MERSVATEFPEAERSVMLSRPLSARTLYFFNKQFTFLRMYGPLCIIKNKNSSLIEITAVGELMIVFFFIV